MPTEIEAGEEVSTLEKPEATLAQCIDNENLAGVQQLLEELSIDDQRRTISRCSAEKQAELLTLLPSDEAAELMEHLAESQAVEILEDLPSETAASIVHELPVQLSGDLLREMDEEDSSAIVEAIADIAEKTTLSERISYPNETAGALMSSAFIAFPVESTIRSVLTALSEGSENYSDQDVQYVYVTGESEKLVGVLRLRDIVINRPSRNVGDVMIAAPHRVIVHESLEALDDHFEERPFLGFPVVDEADRLVGLLSRTAVQEALAEHQTDSYLKASGIVSGEEIRSMPLRTRCFRRLCWLAPNIVLNMFAASVIAAYQDTLQAVIALAVFLPMVSDMSGCSGNQAVAVSIRELTLGILRPVDYIRVVIKEGLLGIINGIVLGCVLGAVAAVWKGNVYLGLVIGGALALNTVLSVLIGGLVPLVLKRFKVDPALASGPILTTCTDMCGFFLVLNLATIAMAKLA
jgi:magnesium transporter